MNRQTYVITSTICCFIVLLAVLARYVYENERLISEVLTGKSQVQGLSSRASSLEQSLTESNAVRDELDRANTVLEAHAGEFEAMLASVNKEVTTLEKEVKELKENNSTLTQARDEWESKYEEISSKISGDDYLVRLIKETAELRGAVEKYQSLIAERNQDLVSLRIESDMLKAKKPGEEISNRVIAGLSEELALEKYSKIEREKALAEYKDREDVLSQKLRLYEDSQDKLIKRYEDQIANLKGSLESLSQRLTGATDENGVLKEKMDQMTKVFTDQVERIHVTKSALDSELGKAREIITQEQSSVVLPAVKVSSSVGMNPRDPVTLPAGEQDLLIEGKVLSKASDDQNFVILDMGRQDGLYEGLVLNVWDDQGKIADVAVIQTRDNVSAARVMNLVAGKTVEEGSRVKSR